MVKLIDKIKDSRGDGHVDIAIFVLIGMMVIALAIKVFPAFIVKDQLNTLANQVLRESQLQGKINIDYSKIAETIGIIPDDVTWDANVFDYDKVQFNEEIIVTCTASVEIGLFGEFLSFSIPLKGRAIGKSEVYWKLEP